MSSCNCLIRVEVCEDKVVGGDRTGDALMGAIIGGIIGNNVTKDLPDGGTAGAIIGGMLGHQNSDANDGTVEYVEKRLDILNHKNDLFTFNYIVSI